jgi:protein-S-isoprenylcysteine O-methyltransferase Ste14
MRSAFMIATGRFFFRYRAWLFPLIFAALLFLFHPRPYLPEPFFTGILSIGFLVTLAGEAFRILTIGLDYIERGGKKGAPHASKLVRGGIYAHVRNPMYVGNILLAVGVSMMVGDPWVFVTVLPFFIFFYYAIIAAEESFLRGAFGNEFEDFCREVNRLWPSFKNFFGTLSKFDFNWSRPIEKEHGTAYNVLLALALVPLWRMYRLGNHVAFEAYKPYAIGISLVLTLIYIVLRVLRKTGRLATAA